MSDTKILLNQISALRQRLTQSQNLACQGEAADGGTDCQSVLRPDAKALGRISLLERLIAEGTAHNILLDNSLRQLAEASPAAETRVLPRQLTSRARRVLERGRELLGHLRTLADRLEPAQENGRQGDKETRRQGDRETRSVVSLSPCLPVSLSDCADPLLELYRETVAMTDATLRMVQAFPDAASAQLRLCEGFEAVLGVIEERLSRITAAWEQRHKEAERIENFAGLLLGLGSSMCPSIEHFFGLAEQIIAEARQGAPLRFLCASPGGRGRQGDKETGRQGDTDRQTKHFLLVSLSPCHLVCHFPPGLSPVTV